MFTHLEMWNEQISKLQNGIDELKRIRYDQVLTIEESTRIGNKMSGLMLALQWMRDVERMSVE